jgi:hypothetical protein
LQAVQEREGVAHRSALDVLGEGIGEESPHLFFQPEEIVADVYGDAVEADPKEVDLVGVRLTGCDTDDGADRSVHPGHHGLRSGPVGTSTGIRHEPSDVCRAEVHC